MTQKLPNHSPFKIPLAELIIIVLVVILQMISVGVFSNELFSQLEISRSVIKASEIMTELATINAEIEIMVAKEQAYSMSKEPILKAGFNHDMSLLKQHLYYLKSLHPTDLRLQKRLTDIATKIELFLTAATNQISKQAPSQVSKDFATLISEDTIVKDISRSIAEVTSEQIQSREISIQAMQSDSMSTLFCTLTFRSATAVILILALFLASRYISEGKKAEALLQGAEKKFRSASLEGAARLSAIVETAADGIVTLQPDGRIESANAAMHSIFGYLPEELTGKNIELLMPNFFQNQSFKAKSESPEVGEHKIYSSSHETIGKTRNGDNIPVELSISLLSLEDHEIITAIVRDITERKEAQQRLKDFYSNVSHELRTPLTSIRTALSLIENGVAGKIKKEAKPVVQIAQSEADRLIRLINDLLDIRKIEEGKLQLHLSEVKPSTLIDVAFGAVGSLAQEYQVRLKSKVEASQLLTCDQDRIAQVLTNLLSNAIKFSPAEEDVTVTVTQTDSHHLFTIEDHGPGVSEEQAIKLFGRFEQLNPRDDRKLKGTGLGLAISKAIVDHHGGTIGVDTTVVTGSRFWFKLPSITST